MIYPMFAMVLLIFVIGLDIYLLLQRNRHNSALKLF